MKKLFDALSAAWILIVLFAASFLLACATVDRIKPELTYTVVQRVTGLPPYKTSDADTNSADKYAALIRLHVNSDGEEQRFFCSGFVISDVYAITAAHCLYDDNYKRRTDTIFVHTMDDAPGTTAGAVALNVVSDLGLIRGDFTKFNKIGVSSPFKVQGPFATCGFPYGDVALCTMFSVRGNNLNFIAGDGFIYPGMSGGPVIDVPSGTAIGVNSRMSVGSVSIAPLIGLFYAAGIKVE